MLEYSLPSTPIKVLLTVDEAATALSLGRTYLYRLLMSKEIASVKVGRVRSALNNYVARRLAQYLLLYWLTKCPPGSHQTTAIDEPNQQWLQWEPCQQQREYGRRIITR